MPLGTTTGRQLETDCFALDYFFNRLEDVSLIERAVLLHGERGQYELAVPVGGSRIAGWVCAATKAQAERWLSVLAERPGFPDLRIENTSDGWILDWGADTSEMGKAELGRMYGYSDAAVRNFMNNGGTYRGDGGE